MDSIELKQLNGNTFNIKYNQHVIKTGNVIYDIKSQLIYIKAGHSSDNALEADLRCLQNICIKYGIPQLYIMKSKENELLIARLSKFFNSLSKKD